MHVYKTMYRGWCQPKRGLTGVDGIEDVKHVLQSFSIKDVSDEQLTEDEQEKLADRIKSVLSNLSRST